MYNEKVSANDNVFGHSLFPKERSNYMFGVILNKISLSFIPSAIKLILLTTTLPLLPPAIVENRPPEGLFTVTMEGNLIHALGWSKDPDSDMPVEIVIEFGGMSRTKYLANGWRPDVGAHFGSTGKNFGFDVGQIATSAWDGRYCIYALDNVDPGFSVLGCASLENPTISPVEKAYRLYGNNQGAIVGIITLSAQAYNIPVDAWLELAWCESGFNPFARNPSYPVGGLFQQYIPDWDRRAAKWGFQGASVFHPVANAFVSAQMYREEGAGPWQCATERMFATSFKL